MNLGVPKETSPGETRVSVTPDIVKRFRDLGFNVVVERDAGLAASFTDKDYESAGADVGGADDALGAAVVLKVNQPSGEEIERMSRGATLVSFINTCRDDGTLGALANAGVDAFALGMIPRISRAQGMDVLSSQSNIAGYRATVEAARLYGRFFPLMMTAAGSAKPARVVVLGAGVAGLQAVATARRLGAQVCAYDVRPEVKEQVMSLGAKFLEFDIGESGVGAGGYARALSAEALKRQQEMLAEELKKADIIVSTAVVPCMPAPVLIPEDTVRAMRPGSVIVDLAAANGGNCPLSEIDKTVVKHGVMICGVTNFPALMPSDASGFYARNLFNFLQLAIESRDGALHRKDYLADEITASTLVTHRGAVRWAPKK